MEWVDVMRGLAIVLMIPANFIYFLKGPYDIFFRLIISNVAPTFICLAFGMVILNAERHNFKYFLCRGGYIVLIACLLDLLIRQIIPLYSFDVLYLIGIGIPITFCIRKLNYSLLIFVGASIVAISFLLQINFGYYNSAPDISIYNFLHAKPEKMIHDFFISGWFPLFPWIAYAFWATAFFKYLLSMEAKKVPNWLLSMGVIFTAVGYYSLFYGQNWSPSFISFELNKPRAGFAEIFYPPSLAYILASVGVVIVLAYLTQLLNKFPLKNVILKFGQYSMFIYIAHDILGSLFIDKILNTFGVDILNNWKIYSLLILCTLTFLYLCCVFLDFIKNYWRPSSAISTIIFGK